MSDLQSMWAESAWRRLVENRRRRNRRHLVALLFLAAGMVALLVLALVRSDALFRSTPFAIQRIVVMNNRTVETEEILLLLDVRAGDPWWRLSPAAIRERLAEHPRVERIDLDYAWFHQLRVDVVEREPALAVFGATEGALTRGGWLLPWKGVAETVDLPILRASPGTLPEPGARVDARTATVARLVGRIRETNRDLWRELSEIEIDGSLARVFLRSQRGVIVFSPGVHEELWDRVPVVLGDLRRRGYEDVVLDLRFAGRIVVHLPEGSGADTLTAGNPFEKV